MKKKYLLILMLCLFSMISAKAQHTVVLKVVDQTKGVKTNVETDNNNANVFAWIDDNINKGTWTDWWYPFYNESGTTGSLVKSETDWTWQATFSVAPGTYQWNPHMKTLGWNPINKGVVYYGESNNLSFTVAEDGTVSGTTELIIPAVKTKVVLVVIDKSLGEKTNDVANDETNLYFEGGKPSEPAYCKTNLYDEFINPATGGDWSYHLYPPQGKEIVKNSTEWIWSAEVEVLSGTYTWRPRIKSANGSINETIYEYDSAATAGFLQFNVGVDGAVTGVTQLIIPASSSSIGITESNKYAISTIDNTLLVSGEYDSVKVYNLKGILVDKSDKGNTFATKLDSGIYFVLIDGFSQKILIK